MSSGGIALKRRKVSKGVAAVVALFTLLSLLRGMPHTGHE